MDIHTVLDRPAHTQVHTPVAPASNVVAANNTQSAPQHDSSAQAVVNATRSLNTQLNSLGEKLGEWKAYDSQLPLAEIEGTRIVKALYQTSAKTGTKLRENSYCRIPTKHLTEEIVVSRIAELSPFVVNWLQELEATSLRASHKKGQLNVFTASLSLDALIEVLEATEAGARLNKEKIEAWFDSNLLESLTIRFADKMGINEQSSEAELAKLELVLNAYKAKFASLASGKTFIKEEDCKAMIAVIRFAEAELSILGHRFIARLEKMQKKEDDLLLAL